jgi:hypothetical protein
MTTHDIELLLLIGGGILLALCLFGALLTDRDERSGIDQQDNGR